MSETSAASTGAPTNGAAAPAASDGGSDADSLPSIGLGVKEAMHETERQYGEPSKAKPGAEAVKEGKASTPKAKDYEIFEKDGQDFVRYKSDGQTIEEPFKEALSRQNTHKAATKKFQEAAQLKKHFETLVETWHSDPMEIVKIARKLGHDPVKVAEAILRKEIELDQMSPEQRERMQVQQERAQLEAQKRQMAQTEQEKRMAQEAEQWRGRLEADFDKALADLKYPNDPRFKAQMAGVMLEAHQAGYDPDPTLVAKHVWEERHEEASSLLGTMNDEQLLQFIGPKIIDRIRKVDVARLRSGPTPQRQSVSRASDDISPPQEAHKVSAKKFFNEIRKVRP